MSTKRKQSRPIVKFCGMTHRQDVAFAYDLGVRWFGFNFSPGSKRRLDPDAVTWIRDLPLDVVRVGIFTDPDPVWMDGIVERFGLHYAQVHARSGDIADTLRDCRSRVIRAVAASDIASVAAQPASDRVTHWVVDAAAVGGTGKSYDYASVPWLSIPCPYLVAGGLTPYNVRVAVAASRPYGVDVSSGIELPDAPVPPRKDAARMKAFVSAVWGTDRHV